MVSMVVPGLFMSVSGSRYAAGQAAVRRLRDNGGR